MHVRDIRPEDIEIIRDIRNRHYPKYSLPSLLNSFCTGVVVNESDEFAGFGQVKAYAEAIILLNKDMSHIQQVKALKTLEHAVRKRLVGTHVEELHCHIHPDSNGYARELIDHFGYREIPGSYLVLDLV